MITPLRLVVDKPTGAEMYRRPGQHLSNENGKSFFYFDSMSNVCWQYKVKIVEIARINVNNQNTAESSR